MLKVGLTGGYASGKSFVAAELARLGCILIYADELGHKVLLPGGDAYEQTAQAFGPAILSGDGSIDRKKLGQIVFSSPELLNKLTDIVHPAVFRLEADLLAEAQRKNPNAIAVIEAAILIETGRYKVFDRLILTACSEATQIARGMARDGLGPEAVKARIGKQLPLHEKKKYADYVVDTDGTKEQTLGQVDALFRHLESLAKVDPK
ncbi:MAG: dephospho-CoA kinase [Bryobacteraceae bacterium]